MFSIGGKWKGRVKAEHADPRLLIVLKLFCGMLIFNDDARRHMRTLARDVAAGQVHAQAREAGSRPLHEPAPRAVSAGDLRAGVMPSSACPRRTLPSIWATAVSALTDIPVDFAYGAGRPREYGLLNE